MANFKSNNEREKQKSRLEDRAKFVAAFVDSNSRKGIKTGHSISQLANRVLFVSEKTIFNDLRISKKY